VLRLKPGIHNISIGNVPFTGMLKTYFPTCRLPIELYFIDGDLQEPCYSHEYHKIISTFDLFDSPNDGLTIPILNENLPVWINKKYVDNYNTGWCGMCICEVKYTISKEC
jgi:hypothetical protein